MRRPSPFGDLARPTPLFIVRCVSRPSERARKPSPPRSPSEAEKPLSWFSERLESRIVFGGFAGQQLVGVVGLRVETTAKLAHVGRLWGTYVAPHARRQGLAEALTRRVLDEARGVVEQIHLSVVASNEAAIRLYAAAGFKEYGVERRALKIGGRYYDEILMAWEIEPRKERVMTPSQNP
jgi:RimJ/RimL family protein N-acetyltransferase